MSVEFAVKLTDQVTAPTRAMAGGLAQAAKNANLLEKQMAALVYLTEILCRYYKIPGKNILGHCQVPGADTDCPGKLFPWQEFHNRFKSTDVGRIPRGNGSTEPFMKLKESLGQSQPTLKINERIGTPARG